MGATKEKKTMKVGKDPAHDKAVYTWFIQQRFLGNIVTGAMLRSKAIQYYNMIHGHDHGTEAFQASNGWQWHFCQCHGIHNLSVEGEKLSGNCDEAKA